MSVSGRGQALLQMNSRSFAVRQAQHQLPPGQIHTIQCIYRRRRVLGPVKVSKAKPTRLSRYPMFHDGYAYWIDRVLGKPPLEFFVLRLEGEVSDEDFFGHHVSDLAYR